VAAIAMSAELVVVTRDSRVSMRENR